MNRVTWNCTQTAYLLYQLAKSQDSYLLIVLLMDQIDDIKWVAKDDGRRPIEVDPVSWTELRRN